MKKHLISFIFSLGAFGMAAQQIEQFSMYMENNYLINPAEAGTTDYIDAKASVRSQWTKLGNAAPQSYFISAHSPLGKQRNEFAEVVPRPYHGIGFAFIGDQIYTFNRNNLKLSYSFQLPVNTRWTFSAGVHAGFQQFSFNPNVVDVSLEPDKAFGAGAQTAYHPDLSFGLWGHTHNFYFGLASFQLIPAKNVNFEFNQDGERVNALRVHHWFTTGLRIPLDEKEHFNLVPNLVVKAVNTKKATEFSTFTADVNCKMHYQDHVWLGLSYRHKDALVGILGLTIKRKFDVAYSYDISFNNARQIRGINSHEILLGYRIATHPHEQAPAPFW